MCDPDLVSIGRKIDALRPLSHRDLFHADHPRRCAEIDDAHRVRADIRRVDFFLVRRDDEHVGDIGVAAADPIDGAARDVIARDYVASLGCEVNVRADGKRAVRSQQGNLQPLLFPVSYSKY